MAAINDMFKKMILTLLGRYNPNKEIRAYKEEVRSEVATTNKLTKKLNRNIKQSTAYQIYIRTGAAT